MSSRMIQCIAATFIVLAVLLGWCSYHLAGELPAQHSEDCK